jgi:predicted DNA-binding transcriptional regulator YafY
VNATERRKQIIEALCSRRYEKIENLAFEFSVTKRTIKNDIAELSLSYPIYTKPGKYDGGIYVADGYYIGKQYLTDEQENLLKELTDTVNAEQAAILNSIIKKFSMGGRK